MQRRSFPEGPPSHCLDPTISVSPSAAGCSGQDMKAPYGINLRSAPRPVVWYPCCRPPVAVAAITRRRFAPAKSGTHHQRVCSAPSGGPRQVDSTDHSGARLPAGHGQEPSLPLGFAPKQWPVQDERVLRRHAAAAGGVGRRVGVGSVPGSSVAMATCGALSKGGTCPEGPITATPVFGITAATQFYPTSKAKTDVGDLCDRPPRRHLQGRLEISPNSAKEDPTRPCVCCAWKTMAGRALAGVYWKRGRHPPPPSRAPSLCPATVSH